MTTVWPTYTTRGDITEIYNSALISVLYLLT